MNIIHTHADLRQHLASLRTQGIALVPTMGNLHEGHLTLVRTAQQYAKQVVVSIFVNPLQFGVGEDYERYPRTLEADCEQLKALGVQTVFAPTVQDLYPNGEESSTTVQVPKLGELLCGRSRPTHFVGVTTIVCKLFNLVQPDHAVFGCKDYQQLTIIKQMVADLFLPVTVLGVPIVREADGLALSSRNQYLTAEQRASAPQLYQSLQAVAERIQQGERSVASLEQFAHDRLKQQGFVPDYVNICDPINLTPAELARSNRAVILAAAKLGQTRLIDNLMVSF